MKLIEVPEKADFGLELSFGPEAEHPADMFHSMADIIRAFEENDRELVRCFDFSIKPSLLLQSVETGSIRTWFSYFIRELPDDALRNMEWKKVLGPFLVKAKYKSLEWLEEKKEIKSRDEIELLREEISRLKNEIEKLRQMPTETKVPLSIIVNIIKNVSNSLHRLHNEQTISFISSGKYLEINRSFSISDMQIEEILTHTHKTEFIQIPLMIRKPDYLGTSMWDVVTNGRSVKAKIIDQQWLERFHHREIVLLPGDAILSNVRIDAYFDENGEAFETKYTVEGVGNVVRDKTEQMDMFGDMKGE